MEVEDTSTAAADMAAFTMVLIADSAEIDLIEDLTEVLVGAGATVFMTAAIPITILLHMIMIQVIIITTMMVEVTMMTIVQALDYILDGNEINVKGSFSFT